VHYSDDAHDDDLVGPRRGGAPRSHDDEGSGGEDLVGPRRGGAPRASRAAEDDGDEPVRRPAGRRSILDDEEGDGPRIPAPRLRRRGGGESGAGEGGGRGLSRETLKGVFKDIPNFVKLLARLARDPRVSKVDKAVVAAVLVYLVSPVDLIPDWVVPVVGQMEDVYLLALALSRLVNNAGIEVLMDHWDGEMTSLETALAALDRAGSVLPGPVQALLGKRR
jgi:uncharacterized membrane protein YkvA (DUF1232 family)